MLILRILRATASEYRNNMPKTFYEKNKNYDIMITYLLILMTSA